MFNIHNSFIHNSLHSSRNERKNWSRIVGSRATINGMPQLKHSNANVQDLCFTESSKLQKLSSSQKFPTPRKIHGPAIKIKIKHAIDKLKSRRTPIVDSNTVSILQEIPKKTLLMLTYIFNVILQQCYFPKLGKIAKFIMIPKLGKPSENPESHRPISLLVSTSKLF